MKVIFGDKTELNVTDVEEVYYGQTRDNTSTLSIKFNTNDDVDTIKSMLNAAALATITVEVNGATSTFTNYTVIDSIRKFFSDDNEPYNAAIDLKKG